MITKSELIELLRTLETFPRGEVEMKADYLLENGVDATGDTPLREKIKWLNQINGTSTKVLHDGAEYTVDGLIQKRNEIGKYITVILKPCNGADSLSYVRVQDIEGAINETIGD